MAAWGTIRPRPMRPLGEWLPLRTRPTALSLVLPGLLALAGCDEPAPRRDQAGAPAIAAGRPAEAARATEERLRARLGATGPLTQRAVHLHRQALGETLVICGQVNPTGRSEDAFIPYVAVAAFDAERLARLDLFLAATTAEATRVYFEMVDRCWEGGGPTSARTAVRPLPPAPSGLPRSAGGDAEAPVLRAPAAEIPSVILPGPAAGVPGGAPAGASPGASPGAPRGSVLTNLRTPANIRSEPSGGGTVLRVAPRGSELKVFSEAPGGWYQVGEAEPWGWVHASMLEAR